MSLDVLEKGSDLISDSDVSFRPDLSRENQLVFEVASSNQDEPYQVEIGRWNEATCGCQYSLNHGHKGQLCSHRIACLIFASVHAEEIREAIN